MKNYKKSQDSRVKIFLASCLLLLVSYVCPGQTIKGRVIDATTNQTLPFVSILIKNTQTGTLTDIDGKFQLTIPTLQNAELQISYLGYQPQTIALSSFQDLEKINIKLKPQVVSLQEISVKAGENPAHRIIKNTTKNRDKNNPEKMHSFTYTSYTKFFVTNDVKTSIDSVSTQDTTLSALEKFFKKQHLLLIESVTQREFLHPDKSHETVLASRVSGLKNSPFALLATQLQSFSFYNYFVTVLDEKFLNPISEGSTRKYFFLLEDTLYNGKDTVFVISFRPRKNKNFDGMKGVLYINTNGYAIQNVIAEPERKDNTISIKIQQKYEFIDGKQWFPVQLNTDWIWNNVSAGSKGSIQKENLKSVSRTYIKDIVLNPELKKKLFSEVETEIDKHADKQDEAFWNEHRTDSLTNKDRKTYRTIDSIGNAENFEKKFKIVESILTNKLPIGFLDLNLDKILKFNSYENTRLGLGLHTNQKLSKLFTIGGYAGYGFKDKAWKYGGDASVFLWKRKELALNLFVQKDIVESGGTSFFENTNTLASSDIYRDVYVSKFDHQQKYQASLSFRMFKYFKVNAFINHQQRNGSTLFNYTAKDGTTAFRDTFNYNEVGLQVKYVYKEVFLQTMHNKLSLGSDYPVLYVNIVKGFNQTFFNQAGNFDYWKFDLKIDAKKTFKTIGTTQLQLLAGKVIGNLPYTMLYNNRGSNLNVPTIQSFEKVSAINSFETMGLNEFASDQFAALFLNHNIGRFLKPSKKFNPELELVHNMGIGSISNPQNIENISVAGIEKGYIESGLRVLHILKSNFTTFGVGVFYRYGAYQKSKPEDNLAVKLVLSIKL
ncbi:MAG: DUF5686 and carboxypeptidase-like regulatory domain-containing protein [Bacteroidia bacterium]